MRADSGFNAHAIVALCRKLDVRFSITVRQHQSLRNLIEAIPEADRTPVPYWMDGAADVAETNYTPFQSEAGAAPVRLIVRRVKPTPGSQLALFATYSYHAFITDQGGDTLELELDHRRHAEIENAIRDLKYGVGLNHLPPGRFPANAAWLAVQVLARWVARIGLKEATSTKTRRRRVFSLAGRLTGSARRLTLHFPKGWPWECQFRRALVVRNLCNDGLFKQVRPHEVLPAMLAPPSHSAEQPSFLCCWSTSPAACNSIPSLTSPTGLTIRTIEQHRKLAPVRDASVSPCLVSRQSRPAPPPWAAIGAPHDCCRTLPATFIGTKPEPSRPQVHHSSSFPVLPA